MNITNVGFLILFLLKKSHTSCHPLFNCRSYACLVWFDFYSPLLGALINIIGFRIYCSLGSIFIFF